MHSTIWNVTFTSLIGEEIDVIDTLHFNNDVDFLSIGNSTGNATEPWVLVRMHMVNEWYQQNSTTGRLDRGASSDIGEVLS